jgi:gliding motility-associated-like protein
VIVKDANNCSATSNVTLSQPATITATLSVTSNYNGQHISCYGEHDANLMVVANNGVAPFTYEWSSNSIVLGNTLSGVGAGTYSVTVKDANECAIIKSIQVTQPLQLIATANVISDFNGYDISCFGANDGIASASATGGTGVYTYQWLTIPPQLNDTAYQLSAGSFTVSVRDINECLATATVSVQQPLAVNVNAQVTSNYNGEDISCFGVNDGITQASASGGTGVFTYSWSTQPVQTTSTANQLSAGSYTVTVKDENNCHATATVTLQQPDQLTASAIVTSDYNGTDISCFGFQDGAAEVTSNGGTGSYYYTWNTIPIQSADSVSGLGAGTYSVIVLDVNKCSTTASVTLEQPAAITATLTVTSNYNGQHISCYGEHDASLIVVANNGVAPYTYEWSSNSIIIGNTLSGGAAGTYSVIVTDANECSLIKSTQVTQPEQLIATSTVISDYNGFDISCFGANNGMASASANGGTGVYTFQWTTNPVQQNNTAVNLTAGSYQVIVTDANQCESTTSITLQQPDQIMISLLDISDYNNFNISCYGSNDGYIDISIQGGVTAYQYNWSNGSTNQDLTDLIAGNYMVTVTDANNCISQLSVELNQPEQLAIQVDSISNYNGFNVSCNGSDDGFIAVTVFGGVTSYNFVWSNNTSSEDLYNIGSGTYNLLITDANKCTQSISLLLNEPTEVISSSIKQEPLCYGLNTGSIDVSINGGVANYTYNWSNGPQTEDIDNLVAGNYTLTYHDQNNCSGSLSVTINQPDQLLITKNVEPIACYGDSLGNILTEVSGGVVPYNYSWSNQLSGNNLLNIPAGVYMLLVKDANNCSVADTTVLIQPDSLQATLQSSLYYNGHHVSLNNAYDGSINLTVTGGVGNYNYLWSNGETSEDIAQLHAGTYYVTVIDSNNCRVSTSIVLTEPYVLEMPEGFSPNDDGKNDYFIVHGIESYPKNNLKIFNRWGNIVYQKDNYINSWHGENTDGQELPDATYFAILEINNGDIVLKGYVEIRKK